MSDVWSACHLWGYAVMAGVAGAASVTDIRRHRIPNQLLIRGATCAFAFQVLTLVAGIGAHLGSRVGGAEGWWPLLGAQGGVVVVNSIVGALLAWGVYALGLWSAGDAKLCMVLALAQPAWHPLDGPVPWAPVLVVVGNALIVALIFLAAEGLLRGGPLLWRWIRQGIRWPAEGVIRTRVVEQGRTLAVVGALALGLGPLRAWLTQQQREGPVAGGAFFVFLFLFFLYRPLYRLAQCRVGLAVAGAVGLLGVAITSGQRGREAWQDWGSALTLGAAVLGVKGALSWASWVLDSRAVLPDQLRPGMVLADRSLQRLGQDEQWLRAFGPVVGSLRGVELEENLIKNLKVWHAFNAPGESFFVRAPLPLAPALLAGVVVTWWHGGLLLPGH